MIAVERLGWGADAFQSVRRIVAPELERSHRSGRWRHAAEPEQFVAHPRPRPLHLVFSNGATADLRIADEHEFHTFEVEGAIGVIWVEVQIIEAWQGQSGSDLSITSIEFRRRR